MKTQLTSAQIQTYQDQGHLAVEDFLSPEELDEMRAAVDKSVQAMGKKKVTDAEVDLEESDDYYARVFTQRLNLWKINDTIKRYMLDPGLGKMLSELAGAKGIRVWHDQALIKPPFGNPTAWHLDNPYWSFHARNAISIWIALDDATYQNGCLYFIPGSQKTATYDNVGIGQNIADLFDLYPEFAKVDPAPAPLRAGSCSFHNGLCAHGAGANMTRGRRRAMTCAYMPEGSTFNGQANILPKRYTNTLKVGDTLDSEEFNPLVYHEA